MPSLEQLGAVLAELAVALLVLGVHVERLLDDELREARREAVARCGTRAGGCARPPTCRLTAVGRVALISSATSSRRGEELARGPRSPRTRCRPTAAIAERGGDAESGRATDGHALDRPAHALVGVADEDVAHERQTRLVDEVDLAVLPPDRAWDVARRPCPARSLVAASAAHAGGLRLDLGSSRLGFVLSADLRRSWRPSIVPSFLSRMRACVLDRTLAPLAQVLLLLGGERVDARRPSSRA